ncbi:uncharacterized mitochondrial protein AtMg00810-like [Rutidosis leptorrhynchoides]|uniref:uncharacterized mitochondrial protein AtMg00810-like n=1 Tax=Rutidosis leptorrhynchoides TaxID=125765 RepID=UPI003A997812
MEPTSFFLLVYVDDIILTGNNPSLISKLIQRLNKEFALKDLGKLHYFLGLEIKYFPGGLTLSQTKYPRDLPTKENMREASKINTLIALKPNQLKDDDEPVDPTELRAIKRILRYIKGTLTHGLQYLSQSSLTLNAFCDGDWAGCPKTRRCTTGFCIFLGANCVSWASKKQPTVSRSSTEVEYRSLATTNGEVTWLKYLFEDLGILSIMNRLGFHGGLDSAEEENRLLLAVLCSCWFLRNFELIGFARVHLVLVFHLCVFDASGAIGYG